MVKPFGLNQLTISAAAHADSLWTRLQAHEKRHGCAALVGVDRPYCPLHEELQMSWHRAWLFKAALLWLLDPTGRIVLPSALSEEVRP